MNRCETKNIQQKGNDDATPHEPLRIPTREVNVDGERPACPTFTVNVEFLGAH